MNFKLITDPLYTHLDKLLSGAESFQCSVAYLNRTGLGMIEPYVEDILKLSGNIHFIHGLEPSVTEPDTIRRLVKMKEQNYSMQYHVLIRQASNSNIEDTKRLFHPKIYLINKIQDRSHCVIGSSNLTLGGLQENYEINALISGDIKAPEIVQCVNAFKEIAAWPDLVTPNYEFCSIYDQIYEVYQSWDQPDSGVQNLIEKLRSTQEYSWRLNNQSDCVAAAIFELTYESHEYVHLDEIYERGRSLALKFGKKEYDWETWENSVRRCIYTNLVGKGKNLFLRRETDAQSGYYRLSDEGEIYVLSLRKKG